MRAALRDVAIGAFWDSGQGESEGARGAYADLLADIRARSVPIERPETLCGERAIGGVSIEVLAPCPSFDASRSPNDNSLVVRFTFGESCALFVGDAEREEEALVEPSLHACEVLKVGHHGSRTSSSAAFLDALSPRYALLSSGVRNRFGHPHAETMASLEGRSVRVLRTDTDGGILLETNGHAWQVTTARTSGPHGLWLGWLD